MAIAILGLGLTAILSAQAGAFANAVSARNISEATGLARCRMSELEEHLLRDGFQELDENDSGPCCDGEDSPTMKCAWKIEKLKMPEPQYGQLDLNSNLDMGGFNPGGGTSGSGMPSIPGMPSLPGFGSEGAEGAEGGDFSSMLGPMVQMVFPVLQNIYETSTRRVTVTVTWNEGPREQSLEVMQWVVNSATLGGGQSTLGSSSSSASSAGGPR